MGTGTALWAIYGILLERWPIIIANAISVCLILSLIGMKAGYHSVSKEKP